MSATINEQLLGLDHEIRQAEHALRVARSRRRWSNLSLIFGPVLAVILYSLLWIPWISRAVLWAIYIPTVPVVVGFCVASYILKRYPGGPRSLDGGPRMSEGELELQLAQQRDMRKVLIAQDDVPIRVRRISYKGEAYAEIDDFRAESRGYRRVSNMLQGTVIIGSLAATGASGAATVLPNIRWAVLGITFMVGIASGFMGYFKYKERSFYLQQTADAIESEWEAYEIGVGRYKKIEGEEEALREFVDEVHRLKAEQKKREQNLEQPPEGRTEHE